VSKRKVHPNHPTQCNPEFAMGVYDSARRPIAWLIVGRRLRYSAEVIFERENPVSTRFWGELERRVNLSADGNTPSEDFDHAKFPPPNLNAAYMLVAFAIENLLKGLMIAKGIVRFSGQRLPSELVGHDLYAMHKLATPKATVPQHVLEALTTMSVWSGRYPLPLNVAGFWRMDDNGALKGVGFTGPESHSEFLAYYDGLEAELQKLTSGTLPR
jgi:hypothetical protein